MKAESECVLVLDVGQGRRWYYSPITSCASDPKYLYPGSHVMTDDAAINSKNVTTLSECISDDLVFVKTRDKFYTCDEHENFIQGLRVWRLVKVIEHTTYPG